MNKKEPKLMSLSRMRSLFTQYAQLVRENIFMNDEIAILHGDPHIFRILMELQPPFIINDYRMGILMCGEIVAEVNLVEKRIMAGSLVFIGPGTIIHPHSISDDARIYGFGLAPGFPMPFAHGQMPAAFNGQVRDFQLPATPEDIDTARRIIDKLWHVVKQPGYDHALVASLVAAQMHHYSSLYRRHAEQQPPRFREQTIFDRFIDLINEYATEHHHLSFYASRMCLTERYLGTVIRQASGITAKEWIDRAIVTRIKVELRHADKSVAQISAEMGFPNPSFFSKYFKRITGMTPGDYKSLS